MVKSSLFVLVAATFACNLVSAVGITDNGCYGNELNNNASKAREDCIKKLLSQTGVNLYATADNCKCSATGMTGGTAAQFLYKLSKGNMDRNQNKESCFVNVGDCFNQSNIRTCGVSTVTCTNK
ncbi:unnamed protein product [Absidia cylindrospora]